MKKSNGFFSKLQNLNFSFSSFAERVKDNVKRKNRALRVKLKKVPWIYKLYVRLRKARYNFQHSKIYLAVSNKYNALLDKLLTDKIGPLLSK